MHISGKVLVCDSIDQAGINSLKGAGMAVDYLPEINTDELISRVKEYHVIIVRSRTKITKEVINAAINVKIIARVGVGLDNIDLNAAELRNIRVINAAEAAINAVSELAIGHMISLARSIPYADAETKKGHWIKKDLISRDCRSWKHRSKCSTNCKSYEDEFDWL
jgi:D-3-phosphoglycerate dehydrogenase